MAFSIGDRVRNITDRAMVATIEAIDDETITIRADHVPDQTYDFHQDSFEAE